MKEGMKAGIDYPGISIVFYCHDGEGNFVMAKRGPNCRDEIGAWDPGAGALELGEHVKTALRREVREEYRSRVIAIEHLGFRDVHRVHEWKRTHWITLDFKVRVDRTMVRLGEPDKFTDIGWFRIDDLPTPLHSQMPVFVEKYRDQLIA